MTSDPFVIEEDATSYLRQDGYRGSVELVFDTDSDLALPLVSLRPSNEPTRKTPRTATARPRRHRFLPVCQPPPAIVRYTRDGLPLVGTSSTTPRASSTCFPPATRPCSGSWVRTTSTRTFRCISSATTTTLWTSFLRRRRFSPGERCEVAGRVWPDQLSDNGCDGGAGHGAPLLRGRVSAAAR